MGGHISAHHVSVCELTVSRLIQKSHDCMGQAAYKGHHGALQPTTLLLRDWNEGSHTWPWASNSRGNPKTDSLANRLQCETAGQGRAAQTGPQVYCRQNIRWAQVGETGVWVCSLQRGCYKPKISLISCSCLVLIIHNNFIFYSIIHAYYFK